MLHFISAALGPENFGFLATFRVPRLCKVLALSKIGLHPLSLLTLSALLQVPAQYFVGASLELLCFFPSINQTRDVTFNANGDNTKEIPSLDINLNALQ